MSNWAARMHRRATTFGNVVTLCGLPTAPYPRRLEKVKFGVPLDEVCKDDIPGPLLVLLLKLNKEAPYRKDVFRAPGHQVAMKSLINFLQTGRLVNVDNFSVYTIASVLKKFLRKLPGGIFGKELEERLFAVMGLTDVHAQKDQVHSILTSLPTHTQKLLVLLFGTFRVIAAYSDKAATGMTSEALGVSVAPSFFHTCVSNGKSAKMEDVMKFKLASRVIQYLIEDFDTSNIFGRDNYEFYARVTGRVLRVQGEWICSFRYPPVKFRNSSNQHHIFSNEYIALERYLLIMSKVDDCQSTPAILTSSPVINVNSNSLDVLTEGSLLSSCTRLSISLDANSLLESGSSSSHGTTGADPENSKEKFVMTLDDLKAANRYAESTKSLSFLPLVHERQTQRMKTRSQWFLESVQVRRPSRLSRRGSTEATTIDACATIRASVHTKGLSPFSVSAESLHRQLSNTHQLNCGEHRRPVSAVQRSGSYKGRNKENAKALFRSHSLKSGSVSRRNSLKLRSGATNSGLTKGTSSLDSNSAANLLLDFNTRSNGPSRRSSDLDETIVAPGKTICIRVIYKPRV